MKDMRLVRFNERVKRASTIVGNGGLALRIAGVSRWYATGMDLTDATWLSLAAALIWGGVQMNELLEPKDA